MEDKKNTLNILVFIALYFLITTISGQGNGILEYVTSEEQGANVFVGNVKLDSDLTARHPIDVLNQLEFAFRQSNSHYNLFVIGNKNGIIKTREKIDREVLCEHQLNCDINLDITVRPVQYFEIIKVVVRIQDINDNAPEFPEQRITRPISETTMPGALIPIPSAEDKDSGNFGVQRYEIDTGADSNNSKFALRVVEHSDGSMDINIILQERVDREEKSFYTLTIKAYDGDRNPRIGSIDVDIPITDANDNYPRFENASYERTVSEKVPLMTTILRVHATDPDSGSFGEVVYSFAASTPDTHQAIFGLTNDTGDLFVKGVLDYEQEKSYQLSIQAKDKGPNSLPVFIRVTINVVDLNDLAPQISVNTLTNSGVAEVREGADIGTFVAHLSIQDPDEDGHQRFDCSIDSTLFELIEISGSNKEYTIITNTVFDREDQRQGDEHEIILRCVDYGSPSLTAVRPITVNVLDVNDHAPYFEREMYSPTVQENNSRTDFIIQMQVYDLDSGRNAAISYSLEPSQLGDGNAIVIDTISGVVTANIVFDYETRSSYHYTVIARDHGDEPRSGTAQLNITIRDINDEWPQFEIDVCNLPIEEGKRPGTYLQTLRATDRDGRPFNVIKYSLDRRSKGSADFRIDQNTGELFSNGDLDRETQAVYHLVIVASNEGPVPLISMLNCTIHVLDINDNNPVIDFPNSNNRTLEISNKLSINQVITHIQAHDDDYGPNAVIRFDISSGNEDDYFRIDEASGAIVVARELSGIKRQSFELTIVAVDQGPGNRQDRQQLIITIDSAISAPSTSQSGGFIRPETVIILGVVFGVLFVIIALAFIVSYVARRRRQHGEGNKHPVYKLGTHEALNTSPSSSTHENRSMTSESSSNSARVTGTAVERFVDYGFDSDTAYLQRNPPASLADSMTCTAKRRYSDRPHPHHSDPRKEFEFGQYDRSPIHPAPSKPAVANGGRTPRCVITKRPSDHTVDRSLEASHDVFNSSNHTDMDSECSGTDSGRGASEEGDHLHSGHALNPFATHHGGKYESYISREPMVGPLYEVPENGWSESETSSPTAHLQHHQQMSASPKPDTNSQIGPSGNRRSSADSKTRLPHVEPLGMYSNRSATLPRKVATPTPPNQHSEHVSTPENSSQRSLNNTPLSPKSAASMLLPELSRSVLYNSKLKTVDNIKTNNGLVNGAFPLASTTQTHNATSLSCNNNHFQSSQPVYAGVNKQLTKPASPDHNGIAPGRTQDETSFIVGNGGNAAQNKNLRYQAKKAVQFADDVLSDKGIYRRDVPNTGNGTPTLNRSSKSPTVGEKSKHNISFYEDTDCLTYSVV